MQANAEVSRKDEGLNVRIGKSNQDVYVTGNHNRNASARYLCEDKPEAESKSQEELSRDMQPMRTKPGGSFFLVVCLKKY